MDFVKKHFTKIIYAIILISMFFNYVSFYVQPYQLGETYGDKEFMASVTLFNSFRTCGIFVFLVPICALGALICTFIKKQGLSLILLVAGFISTLISPSSIFNNFTTVGVPEYLNTEVFDKNLIYDKYGYLYKITESRSAGFVIILICYILLILISIVKVLASITSGSEGQEKISDGITPNSENENSNSNDG